MVRVYVSTVINAPAAQVWSYVRDFNGMPGWTSFVTHSRIEAGREAELKDLIGQQVFQSAFTSLKQKLAGAAVY